MRTILISGANRGIGYSIAKRALKDGHRISLGVRDPKMMIGTELEPKKGSNEQILISRYDANQPESAKIWINNTISKFKKFDTIINCAGIFKKTPFLFDSHEEKDINDLWETNVKGPWYLIKEAWNELIRSDNSRVIVLVSMSGIRSKGNLAGYSVSKFALMGLCQTIRNQGWNKGLRVTAICPSWVNTQMASEVNIIRKEEMSQPEDIASITSLLLQLPNSSVPFEIKVNCNLEK